MARSRGAPDNLRLYKVTYFGETLGAFELPVGEHMDDPDALPRPVLTKPYKVEGDEAVYFWVEADPDGGFLTVYWRPNSLPERKEAARFFAVANGLKSDGSIDHEKQPPIAARSTEEVALIRGVLSNPNDEQPYLDYADWLARKGDPYAEYIRLSLRMEPLDEADGARAELEDELFDLAEKYGAKWVRGLTELGLFPGADWQNEDEFDPQWWFGTKGVIDTLEIESGTAVFRTSPARLFVAAPFLRRLTLGGPEVTPAQLATIPQMRQIDWLYLECGPGTLEDFIAFAASPHFDGLRHLTVYGSGIDAGVAGVLAGARWMPNLRELSLTRNEVGDDGAEALAGSAYCANLEDLELDGNGLTDRGLIALCGSAHLAQLKALGLGDGAFTAAGIRALRTAPFAPGLRDLDLTRCGLDAPAFAELAAAPLPALKVLDVNGNRAGGAALAALTGAPFFRALEVFGAEDCDLGNEIVAGLARAGLFELTDLALGDNRIDAAGVAALMRSKAAATLRALRLPRNPLGTDGVIELAGSALPHLRVLDLQGVRLGKEAVLALVKAPWRKQLTRLDISEDCVGDRALEVITDRFGENVVRLDVDDE
ncbi:TIGR02996 domain-containing protein [Frigoriglobus tundricola]|uniref:Uncharacterized protein n=1 Tax=Frigoriglobus tundricola TaxID=2774151 RepID=A0A6M5YI42_9BACT|nr:TIGR02996 domain-containing protein [Frigoriglobus tundricola]QJW93749.1 hypothetical protein FTUN_1260 [Frigoriglobus tundricola]